MRQLLTTLIILTFSAKAFSTAQVPDKIIYNGKTYVLHSNPLEFYFNKHPEKRPQNVVISTALWRGYVATFEVRNNKLYVKEIQVETYKDTLYNIDETIWKDILNEVFPNQSEVLVNWLTGLLVIPHGKMINYVHMGYASTYKNYILLEIESGNLIKEYRFHRKEYEKFKERQFLEFKKTDEYKKLVEELKKENDSVEFIDSFLRIYIIEYSTEILIDK